MYAEVCGNLSVMCKANNTENLIEENDGNVDTIQGLMEALVFL